MFLYFKHAYQALGFLPLAADIGENLGYLATWRVRTGQCGKRECAHWISRVRRVNGSTCGVMTSSRAQVAGLPGVTG